MKFSLQKEDVRRVYLKDYEASYQKWGKNSTKLKNFMIFLNQIFSWIIKILKF